MADAAGIVLGAAGVLVAMDSALKTFNLIEGTIRGDKNSQHICLLYEVKRQNVRLWADEMGLNTANPAIERLNEPTLKLVKETLVAIERLHMDSVEYLERYSAPQNVSSLSNLNLAPGSAQLLKSATDARNQRPTHKIRWGLRDRDKFSATLKILGDHIDTLFTLTSSVSKDVRGQQLAARVVSAIQDHNLLAFKAGATSSGSAEEVLGGVLSGIKLLQEKGTGIVGELEPVKGSVKFASSSDLHSSSVSTGTYQPPGNQLSFPVWVEWRDIDTSPNPGHRHAMESRIKRLGYLLDKVRNQPVFRASVFVGLYEHTDFDPTTGASRLGLMYSTPPATDGNPSLSPTISFASTTPDSFPNPLCLREFIATAKSNQLSVPTLGQRVKLATSLCMTFCMLHSAGWLHKGFSSSVVWFFAPLSKNKRPDLEHPYITGYNTSRPTDQESLQRSEVDHRQYWLHPRAVAKLENGGGFTRILDLYSLGVVLLEIGLWRLPEDHRITGSLEKVHNYLSAKRVKKLGFQTGMLYQEVAETLLSCDFTEGADDETLTREFFAKVLSPLAKISVD